MSGETNERRVITAVALMGFLLAEGGTIYCLAGRSNGVLIYRGTLVTIKQVAVSTWVMESEESAGASAIETPRKSEGVRV